MFYTADELWNLSHSQESENRRYELDEGQLLTLAIWRR